MDDESEEETVETKPKINGLQKKLREELSTLDSSDLSDSKPISIRRQVALLGLGSVVHTTNNILFIGLYYVMKCSTSSKFLRWLFNED